MSKITYKNISKCMSIDEYEEKRKLVNPTLFERIKNVFCKPKINFDFRKLL